MSTGHSVYWQSVAAAAAELKRRTDDVRTREEAGELTIRQSADLRIEALEIHLTELKIARQVHLGGGGDDE